MKKHEKYLEVLKTFTDYITITQWSERFKEMYADDFKTIEESAKNHNTKSNGLRELNKKISVNISNNNNWKNIIEIDNSTTPRKVKYLSENKRNKDIKKETKKTIKFSKLMEELKYLIDDAKLPHRDDNQYVKLEQIHTIERKNCLLLEMAIRTKEVIAIIDKIEYIEELGNKYPSLAGDILTLRNLGMRMLISDYIQNYINEKINLSLSDFKKEFGSNLLDIEFGVYNYNKIQPKPLSKNIKKHDPLNKTQKIELSECCRKKTSTEELLVHIIPSKELLNTMVEILQRRLNKDFFIYPKGYFKGVEYVYNEQINHERLSSHYKRQHNDKIINFYEPNPLDFMELDSKEKSKFIKDFKLLSSMDMKQIADIFFIYDYYKKRPDSKFSIIQEDIKFELTKYHGITINGKKLSYNQCLIDFEKLKNSDASFTIVEKSISNKMKLLKNFIDNKLYKHIPFI